MCVVEGERVGIFNIAAQSLCCKEVVWTVLAGMQVDYSPFGGSEEMRMGRRGTKINEKRTVVSLAGCRDLEGLPTYSCVAPSSLAVDKEC